VEGSGRNALEPHLGARSDGTCGGGGRYGVLQVRSSTRRSVAPGRALNLAPDLR
jgi:hypothetical protein